MVHTELKEQLMLKVPLHLCRDIPEWHRLETHLGQASEQEEAAEAALCGPYKCRSACEERFLLPHTTAPR